MKTMSQLYARVFLQILDSSIAEDFTVRHVFEDFLKICDHKTGVVDMTRQALSRRLNIPAEVLNKSISKLESPDENSRDQEFEGRRIEKLDEHRDWGWKILNWEKYDRIRTNADNYFRVSRHRQKETEGLPESPKRKFTDLWMLEYEKDHGCKYVFQGAKDGQAADRLLKNATPDELIALAKEAWKRPDGFNCKYAASISGFSSKINEMRQELKHAPHQTGRSQNPRNVGMPSTAKQTSDRIVSELKARGGK